MWALYVYLGFISEAGLIKTAGLKYSKEKEALCLFVILANKIKSYISFVYECSLH